MAFTRFLIAVVLCVTNSVFAAPQPKCSKDTCLQAVRDGGKARGFGGCKAFFKATVTPATVTLTQTDTISSIPPHPTTTSTVTITQTSSSFVPTATSTVETLTTTIIISTTTASTTATYDKRANTNKPITNSPTNVPRPYSSACPDTKQYSSACSCVGAKHVTSTVPAPTVTKTLTTTLVNPVVTRTVISTKTISTFVAKTNTVTTSGTTTVPLVIATSCNPNFMPHFYMKAVRGVPDPDNSYLEFNLVDGTTSFAPRSAATKLTRDANCILALAEDPNDVAFMPDYPSYEDPIYFVGQNYIQNQDLPQISCLIGTFDHAMLCSAPTSSFNPTVLEYCGDVSVYSDLFFASSESPGCTALTLVAEPAS